MSKAATGVVFTAVAIVVTGGSQKIISGIDNLKKKLLLKKGAGNAGELFAKIDNLGLQNIKNKLNDIDEATRNKIAEDIANLADEDLFELEDNFGLLDDLSEIYKLDDAAKASRKPEWLRKIKEGIEFNKTRSAFYPYNEVYLINPKNPSKKVILDSYKPGQEIVSRKYTQFADIKESTGIKYIQELYNKYPKGKAIIADVASNKTVNGVKGSNYDLSSKIGQTIDGEMILEVPIQTKAIPNSILNEARNLGIKIRDVQGKIY